MSEYRPKSIRKRKEKRSCSACLAARPQTAYEPDPCLGWLPGVRFACCGHGFAGSSYVMTEDGTVVREEEARDLQKELGGEPAPFTSPRVGNMRTMWPRDPVVDALPNPVV